MDSTSFCRHQLRSRPLVSLSLDLCAFLIVFVALSLAGCVSGTALTTPAGKNTVPTIASFTASPTGINSGTSSTLSWSAAGATSIAITPGTFTSTSPSGSTSLSPTATTTYTLTATNATGSSTSTLTITVSTPSKPTIGSLLGVLTVIVSVEVEEP